MNNYTVYCHTSPSGKRYIGVTSMKPEIRWNNGNGYKHSILLNNAIQKYGWENIKHEILFDGLSKEEAEEKEIELITLYKSNDKKYGYNIMSGGVLNRPHSDDTKVKISKAQKGIKVNSIETRAKISKAKAGIKHHAAKPILQLDKDGNIIREWAYANLAAETLNIKRTSISACAKNKMPSAGGFIWRYHDNMNPPENYTYRKSGTNRPNRVVFYQYDINMNLIAKYKTTREIADSLNKRYDIVARKISDCCVGKKKTYQGYIWERKEEKIIC